MMVVLGDLEKGPMAAVDEESMGGERCRSQLLAIRNGIGLYFLSQGISYLKKTLI